jgi:hypothetical protein
MKAETTKGQGTGDEGEAETKAWEVDYEIGMRLELLLIVK